MKIHKIEQGTDEWFEVRKSKLTASHADVIAVAGKGLDTYISSILARYYCIEDERNNYISPEMQRGTDLEPIARNIYELETDRQVEEVGFIEMNKFVGCSPDGLIGKDGMLEIKCVNEQKHFEIWSGGVAVAHKKYILQCQMQMLVAKRKWTDLVYYHPGFEKSMLIFRLKPDRMMVAKLKVGIEKGTKLIESNIKKLDKELN